MTPLNAETHARVVAVFGDDKVAAAERLLETECDENLPLVGASRPELLERIRFAAIRVSGGDLERLREAIRLAQTDWRDVLVAAGFAERLDAHTLWQPRRSDSQS